MAVAYRSVLLVEGDDIGDVARAAFTSWLDEPDGLPADTGIYPLGKDSSLTVQHLEPGPESGTLKFSLSQGPRSARWRTSLTVAPVPAEEPRVWLRVEVESPSADAASPRGPDAPADLIGRVLESTIAHDGSAVVTSTPSTIAIDDLPELMRLLQDTGRRYPALVIRRPDQDSEGWWTTVQGALRVVVGMSSQYLLTEEAARELTLQVGEANAVPAGGVRIYHPGLDLSSRLDGRRHRVLSPRHLKQSHFELSRSAVQTSALRAAISRPLPRTLRQAEADLDAEWFKFLLQMPLPEFTPEVTSPPPTTDGEPPRTAAQHGRGTSDHLADADPSESPAVSRPDSSGTAATQETATLHGAPLVTGPDLPPLELTAQLTALHHSQADLQDQVAILTVRLDDEQLETAGALDRARRAEREVKRLRRLLATTTEAANAWLEDTGPPDLPADFAEVLERLDRGDLPFVMFTGDAKVTLGLQAQDPLGNVASRAWEALQALNDYGRAVSDGVVSRAGGVHGYLSSTPDGYSSWPRGGHSPVESPRVRNHKTWAGARMLPVPDGVGDGTGMAYMEAHFKVSGPSGNYVRMHYLDDVDKSGKSYVGHLGPHLPNTRT